MAGKFQYSLGINELKSKDQRLWQSLIAEFLGNLILNFFACGACTQDENGVFKALAFGLGVFMAITIIGHLSGGHVNPAVTLGMLAAGRVSVLRAVLYIIFQCLGSIAGTAAVKILIDNNMFKDGWGHTTLKPGMTELQGLGIEFFLGLVLVLTVFGACDANKPDSRFTAPFAIGMSVTLGHLGTIGYTGASMNPARTLGTAFATGNWTSHWIYWVGPILGGITAALLYIVVLEKPATVKVVINEVSEKYRTHADEREDTYLSNNQKTKGRLPQKYDSITRKYREKGIIESRYLNKQKIEHESCIEVVENRPDEVVNKIWLKNNKQPEILVVEKWRATHELRRKDVDKNIIEEWPILRQQIGATLIELDFDILYPGKSTFLYTKWETLKGRLSAIFKSYIKDTSSKELYEILATEELNEDIFAR